MTVEQWPLVTIDPGVRFTAIALWYDGLLRRADYIPNDESLYRSMAVATRGALVQLVVCEGQYIGANTPRASDIVDLAYWSGAAAYAVGADKVERVQPRAWKGTSPKNLKCVNIYSKLSTQERLVVATACRGFTKAPIISLVKKLQDNPKKAFGKNSATGRLTDIIDAVGIGLWKLKRR